MCDGVSFIEKNIQYQIYLTLRLRFEVRFAGILAKDEVAVFMLDKRQKNITYKLENYAPRGKADFS